MLVSDGNPMIASAARVAMGSRSSLQWRVSRLPMLLALLLLVGIAGRARAAAAPEDLLKGMMIISDRPLPTKWTSAGAYASQLKQMHKPLVTFDKGTGTLRLYYGAFFAQPINDIQVNLTIYDLTQGLGGKVKQSTKEVFIGRKGERRLFETIDLNKTQHPPNKKYLFAIELQGKIIAQTAIELRTEAPKLHASQ